MAFIKKAMITQINAFQEKFARFRKKLSHNIDPKWYISMGHLTGAAAGSMKTVPKRETARTALTDSRWREHRPERTWAGARWPAPAAAGRPHFHPVRKKSGLKSERMLNQKNSTKRRLLFSRRISNDQFWQKFLQNVPLVYRWAISSDEVRILKSPKAWLLLIVNVFVPRSDWTG
jgi:hypothetical protein